MNPDHLHNAHRRLQTIDPAVRPLFTKLVRLVEHGVGALAPLQRVHDATPRASERRDPYGQLLNFIDGDLGDMISGIVSDLPQMIPADVRWAEEADPSEMHADVELIARYLAVARMAADHPAVPLEVRKLFVEADELLRDWESQMIRTLREIDDAVLRPILEAAA
jgi:hypothetical protein